MENNTIKELEDALERILNGNPIRVKPSRKLSVSAVQAEAGLGVGSVYHYPDFVEKIKAHLVKEPRKNLSTEDKNIEIEKLRNKLKEETRIKEKYRTELSETKKLLSQACLENRELAWKIHKLTEEGIS